jgi:hypothetical protein
MRKLIAAISTVFASLALTALYDAPKAAGQGPEPKVKKKGEPKKPGGPGGELRKAYDLLRRLRADDGTAGRPEERLRDWTDRAAALYRNGLKALNAGDPAVAREYGVAAHDLARAVDHARNAARFDRPDPDLPAPADGFGLDDMSDRARRDLARAYERIDWLRSGPADAGREFYANAARDLYSAARRDLEAGRDERGGELARAAEAMTHVPEHLARTDDAREPFRPGPERGPFGDRPDPKAKRLAPLDRHGADLPPPLD